MKGCSIPAPAPWASTTQILEPWGWRSSPETRVVSLTTRVTCFEAGGAITYQYNDLLPQGE
jgi:hypothetical protein